MDEENTMDFKALRAKFQDDELLLTQTLKPKPALPEKPKVVPPPQSPTHMSYMPAGARPSLLSSINQSLEGKTPVAPRVVFKDEKKESKKPLLQTNSKTKDSKIKVGKDKSKGGRERLYDDDVPQPKSKKENKEKKKESTAELVPATAPPKNTTLKKKGFLGFKKDKKKDSTEVPSEPILDSPSSEVSGPVPLIPVPQDFSSPNPDLRTPTKALLPEIPTFPDSSPAAVSSDFTAPVFFPETSPSPVVPALEVDTAPSETLPVSRPESQTEALSSVTPPLISPDSGVSTLATTRSTPSPDPGPVEDLADTLEIPPAPEDLDPGSASPKLERPLSALSVLERAEEMSPGKKTPPGDQRIFNALEKARRMAHNHQKPTSPLALSPAPDEGSPDGLGLYELPPIDYEDKAGKGLGPKPEENGLDHRASLVLEEIAEEDVPEKPDTPPPPPPPPRRALADPDPAPPPKPARSASMDVSRVTPPSPALDDSAAAIPAPAEFSEIDPDLVAHTDEPDFENVTPEAHSPDLPVSDWGSESPEGPHLSLLLPNGTVPTDEAPPTPPAFDGDQPELPESLSNRNSLILAPGGQGDDNPYEATDVTDNVYEDVSTSSKKKGKSDGKKRKGPPKNPYAEAPEATEEKTKTGRFGRADKKAAAAAADDEKEQKKKEKQRLEKEKKELKERQEREKKEQKEKEKRENELKKKFKITGQEDAMYKAKVTVDTKGRKDDLPVKSGDTISIIRTNDCPKGKWLARDDANNYGYVAVKILELDVKEMLELGKKAAVSRMGSTSVEPDVTSSGSRASNHFHNESYDSDWTDDEPLSPTESVEPQLPIVHGRTHSMPDMGDTETEELPINHRYSHSDLAQGSHQQARHEALQKLATFFPPSKSTEPTASPEPAITPEAITEEEPEPESSPSQLLDFEIPDIIPPPEQYADFFE